MAAQQIQSDQDDVENPIRSAALLLHTVWQNCCDLIKKVMVAIDGLFVAGQDEQAAPSLPAQKNSFYAGLLQLTKSTING